MTVKCQRLGKTKRSSESSKDLATACRAREDLCGHQDHRIENQLAKLVRAGKESVVPCQGQEGFSEEVN